MYATNEWSGLLCRARTRFMDSNYAMALHIFQQLYVVSAPLDETPLSCVYAFLPGKTQNVYKELLHSVLDGCERLGFIPDPTQIVLDFQYAAIQAVGSILDLHVSIQGCFYHLTQSTWRKIQESGIVNHYRENGDCKLFCGMMDGLAFPSLETVLEGIQFPQDSTPA